MPLSRPSQAIAIDLRFYLYAVTPGSTYNTWPDGPGSLPVPVEYTATERAVHASTLADMLTEWQETDPEGYAGWERAFLEDPDDADPCTYCRECRGRLGHRSA